MTSTPLEFDATDHRHWAVREDGKRRAAARWCLNLCSLFSCAAVLPKCVCKCRTRSFSDCVWRTDFAVLPRALSGGLWAASPLARGCAGSASIGIAPRRSHSGGINKVWGLVHRSSAICRTSAAACLRFTMMSVKLFIRLPDWLHPLRQRTMQSQRPHHAGVVLFSVHDNGRVSRFHAAGRRCHWAFGTRRATARRKGKA